MNRRGILHPVYVLLLAAAFACHAEKDPVDTARIINPSASFLDVTARRAELASATDPRVLAALNNKEGCIESEQPAPPVGRMNIPHHYLQGSNGPINPEEAKATIPYQKLQEAVTAGASRYVATGEHAEAALSLIH